MADHGAYGSGLGDRFRLETPALVTRALRKAEIAVTHIVCDVENHGMTEPFPYEDAFLVALQIREVPDHELWIDGRAVPKRPFQAGATSFYDLRRNPIAYLRSPSHSLMFYLPRTALNTIADCQHALPIGELDYRPGVGINDPIMRNLAMSLVPSFDRPDEASPLFVDHVTLAIGTHIAQTYGGMRVGRSTARGGLSPWQVNRAKDILTANLDGGVGVSVLAKECGLSASHFSRAFRLSVGMAPHQWLTRRRLEAAKVALGDSRLTLSQIALACGFADQSHFTRVFSRAVGTSPAAWRRAQR